MVRAGRIAIRALLSAIMMDAISIHHGPCLAPDLYPGRWEIRDDGYHLIGWSDSSWGFSIVSSPLLRHCNARGWYTSAWTEFLVELAKRFCQSLSAIQDTAWHRVSSFGRRDKDIIDSMFRHDGVIGITTDAVGSGSANQGNSKVVGLLRASKCHDVSENGLAKRVKGNTHAVDQAGAIGGFVD
jgi:hypothetical protein